MHKVDNSARPPSHVDSQDNPDERLKQELLRIAELDFECPEQRAYARQFPIAERLRELPRLTDLARVPEERQGHFRAAVLDVVLDAWNNDDFREAASKLPSNNAALSRAVKALRAAKRALVDLDTSDREACGWPIAEIEGGIDRFFEWVLGEAERAQPLTRRSGKGRPGRRRGTGAVGFSNLKIFVRDLLRAAEACGGRLTLDRHDKKGTLIEAIDVLAPCLPAGFVPKVLPLSTLQRIKSKRSKRRSSGRIRLLELSELRMR